MQNLLSNEKPPASGNINVYPVVPVDLLTFHLDRLATALFGLRRAKDGNRELSVAPASGCLFYQDLDRLWATRNAAGLPNTAEEAKKIAEQVMTSAGKGLDQLRRSVPELGQVFPDQWSPQDTMPVYALGAQLPDHWLTIFTPRLPTGSGYGLPQSVPVDSTIELRVGPAAPVGLATNWRACTTKGTPTPWMPPPEEFAIQSLHYRVSGSTSPQTTLSPYYLKATNDDGSIAPASSRSMLPAIMGQVSGSALELSAEVTGSPGPFEYTWALWRPDAAQTDSNPVTRPTFLLTQPGFYNVVLDIRDLSTQDVTRIQRLVVLPMKALG